MPFFCSAASSASLLSLYVVPSISFFRSIFLTLSHIHFSSHTECKSFSPSLNELCFFLLPSINLPAFSMALFVASYILQAQRCCVASSSLYKLFFGRVKTELTDLFFVTFRAMYTSWQKHTHTQAPKMLEYGITASEIFCNFFDRFLNSFSHTIYKFTSRNLGSLFPVYCNVVNLIM